jgi:hypothetical protein
MKTGSFLAIIEIEYHSNHKKLEICDIKALKNFRLA